MNKRDYEKAIETEIEQWPGATVEFANPTGKGHPKAKLTFDGKKLAVTYPGTPSDAFNGIHNQLADVRRALRKLGAVRDKPEPTKDEDEAPYRKPNEGAAKRENPIKVENAKPQPDVADQLVAAGVVSGEEAAEARKAVQAGASAATYEQRAVANSLLDAMETAADEVDDTPVDQIRAEFEARVAAIVDGVYFGLPADVYHAVPRLSCSGIQKLLVSPATFWRNSWLDPDRPELDEDETIWQILGRAYHTARLEPHLFEATYVRELDKKEAPKGTLFTGDDMKKKLEDFGLPKTGKVEDLAERLADAGFPSSQLWPLIKRDWEDSRNGRTGIPAKNYDAMITDMERIRHCGPVAELMTGGEAEVSVFWTDEYGVKMKARIDYLTRDWKTDLKTFDNSRGKNLNQALVDAVRYNRYYIQPLVYQEAVEAIRTGNLPIIEAQTDDQHTLVASIRIKPGDLRFWFVFQEKGGVPNLLAREFPFYAIPYTTLFNEQITDDEQRRAAVREATKQRTDIARKGAGEVLQAKKLFALYSEVYEPGTPWFPIDPVGSFADGDFHPYWLAGDMV